MSQPRPRGGILLEGEPVTSLEEYRKRGGMEAYELTLRSEPDAIIDLIRQARLRGRGGAGFPTAFKWQSLRDGPGLTKYVCGNGAEGEPGSFKDRALLQHNPYQVLEGLAIAAHVTGARSTYLGVKQLFQPMMAGLDRALQEFRDSPVQESIEVVWGPDEYLFGEEKALLEVIDGGLPLPRVLPPYMHGLFTGALGGPSEELSNPTAVDNVETLGHVPHIVSRGPEWFRSFGAEDTPGTMIFSVLGDVQQPMVRELPTGLTLGELIEMAGGSAAGRRVKAVLPGLADAVITADRLDTGLSFDAMRQAGTGLGSGGFIVYDDTACMVKVAEIFSHFLYVESCNQCPPCKIGSQRITERLEHLLDGTSSAHEVEDIAHTASWVTNAQRCNLATSEQVLASSILAAFPEEFEDHVNGNCSRRHDLVLPKITDYREGEGFTLDTEYWRKRPDWTYAQ